MKFFVWALSAQLGVYAGSKERWGDLQWHVGVDPAFVEACILFARITCFLLNRVACLE